MTKKQWLRQHIQFDERGRPPSLADVPLQYGSRLRSFELQGYTWGKIDRLYKESLKRNNK
tara:strand:- start:1187 stop:1366 length:180 start_codon:yes stop_codon:yes gene_type:complete